jgi:putative flippase GtrA
MSAPHSEPAARLRHFGGFLLAGGLAFLTDVAILEALTRLAGASPFAARMPAILTAMVVSWLINRRVTFAVEARPSLAELVRFAAVSWLAQVVNYATFAGLLILRPALWPPAAVFCSSLVAMTVSYLGFRFGVFRYRPGAADPRENA